MCIGLVFPTLPGFVIRQFRRKTTKLNEGLKIRFADEEDDHPDYPSAYGVAGWTKNDEQLMVYDRYDLWAFDPQNHEPPVNLTKMVGSKKLSFAT